MTRTYITSLLISLLVTVCFGFTPNPVAVSDSDVVSAYSILYEDAPPTITCPSNVVSPCSYVDTFTYNLSPTTFDDVGVVLQTYTLTGATTGSSSPTGINDLADDYVSFGFGTTTVTYYIEDGDGGSASCSFTVRVTDTQNPLIICPNDISVSTDPGQCYATLNNIGTPTIYDSCPGVTLSLSGIPPGNQFPPGTTVVTLTVTDGVGNTNSCTQNITVSDTEPPSIVCGADVTVVTGASDCDAFVTVPLPTILDNCGSAGSTIVNDYNSGGADASDTYPTGTTTVTFTATDSNNFVTTCSKDIIVINGTTPTIILGNTGPLNLEVCDVYVEAGATAVNPCTGDPYVVNIDDSALMLNGANEVTAVGNGLQVIYSIPGFPGSDEILIVNVVDTTAPVISLIGPNPQFGLCLCSSILL